MKLISARVQNYRAIRDQSVNFADGLTLITGPNESGKSTFAEAIHRALFLNASGNTAAHQEMNSTVHAGTPEVSLVFEADGHRWALLKRFTGNNRGTCQLTPDGQTTLNGDEAHNKLSEIIGPQATGRGAVGQLDSSWAHLFIRQGKAALDPSESAAAVGGDLIQRLQTLGGAALVESGTDQRVAQEVEAKIRQTFTDRGAYRTNSAAGIAEARSTQAQTEFTAAIARVNQRSTQIEALHTARNNLREAAAAIPTAREQLEQAQTNLNQSQELQTRLAGQQTEFTRLQTSLEQQQQNHSEILELIAQRDNATAILAPAREELTRLRTQADAAQQTATTRQAETRQAEATLTTARTAREWVATRRDLARTREALTQLEQTTARITTLRTAKQEKSNQLAALAPVDDAALNHLQILSQAATEAAIRLEAIAADLTWTGGPGPVLANGKAITRDEALRLTEAVEIRVGETILTLRPGGGQGLSEARETERQARAALGEALTGLNVDSIAQAATIRDQRNTLTRDIAQIDAELVGLAPAQTENSLAETRNQITTAETRLAALAERLDDALRAELATQAPENAETQALQTLLDQREQTLAAAEQAVAAAQAAAQAAADQSTQAATAHDQAQAAITNRENEINTLNTRIEERERTHGDEQARQQNINETTTQRDAAQAAVQAIQQQLQALNPDALQAAVTRLSQTLATQSERRNQAERTIAASEAVLHLDGTTDPEGDRLRLEDIAAAAAERFQAEAREAASTQRLHALIAEARSAMRQNLTAPLAEKASRYLAMIHNGPVRCTPTLEDNRISGLQFTAADGTAFAFDTLSHGAREQLAAAFRLAMARVLAGDGGCLPLVFDDAFVNSDRQRIDGIFNMLTTATTDGLQILLLSCHPENYTALGPPPQTFTRQAPEQLHNPIPQEPAPTPSPHGPLPEFGAMPEPADRAPNPPPPAGEDPADLESTFLETLRQAGGKSGNTALRNTLGWDETTYNQVKSSLLTQNRILPGRGQGGTVRLPE